MKALRALMLTIAASTPMIGAGAQEQRVKLTPISTRAAFDEFARICMHDFPQISRMRDAVQRSAFGFQPTQTDGRQWQSSRAVVGLVSAAGRAERCNFDALLTDKVDPSALAGYVHTRLQRSLGTSLPYRQIGQTIVWEWQMEGMNQELTLDFAGTNRQLALSMAVARGT